MMSASPEAPVSNWLHPHSAAAGKPMEIDVSSGGGATSLLAEPVINAADHSGRSLREFLAGGGRTGPSPFISRIGIPAAAEGRCFYPEGQGRSPSVVLNLRAALEGDDADDDQPLPSVPTFRTTSDEDKLLSGAAEAVSAL